MKGEYVTKTGITVIDVQNEYFTGKLPVTCRKEVWRISKKPWTGHTSPRADRRDPAHKPHTGGGHIQERDTRMELHDEIKSRPYDIVVEKTLPGASPEPALSSG